MQKVIKSAKDIAFDKERQKLCSKIRSLEALLVQRDKQLVELQEIIRQKETELTEAKDWIDRLLEYTEMSKEDLQELIKDTREKAEVQECLNISLDILARLGGSFI